MAEGRFYKPQLDALRFGAFLMVFALHDVPHPSKFGIAGYAWSVLIRSGGFGVDLFFALSAYLITTLLLAEREHTGSIDVKAFYLRRALRIWPLYFGFLVVGWLLQFTGVGEQLPITDFASLLFFLGNWRMAFHGYTSDPFALLWSLCIEEQFYIAWALILAFGRGWSLNKLAWAMIGVSVAARLGFALADAPFYATWTATVTRLDGIAVGILIAQGWRPAVGGPWRTIIAGGSIIILAQLLGMQLGERWGPDLSFPLAALGCALVLSGTFEVRINPGALTYLGKVSFGLYVFHVAVRDALLVAMPGFSPVISGARVLATLAVTVAAAAISYRFYESPFLRLKEGLAAVKSRPV